MTEQNDMDDRLKLAKIEGLLEGLWAAARVVDQHTEGAWAKSRLNASASEIRNIASAYGREEAVLSAKLKAKEAEAERKARYAAEQASKAKRVEEARREAKKMAAAEDNRGVLESFLRSRGYTR